MDGEPWRRYTLEEHNKLNYSRLGYLAIIALFIAAAVAVKVFQECTSHYPWISQH